MHVPAPAQKHGRQTGEKPEQENWARNLWVRKGGNRNNVEQTAGVRGKSNCEIDVGSCLRVKVIHI